MEPDEIIGHVADALFQTTTCIERGVGVPECYELGTVALQAARAQGWRIVKTAPKLPAGRESEYVTEEWTG